MHLVAGAHGDIHDEDCVFDNGAKKYQNGHIKFVCVNHKWEHHRITCSDDRCPASTFHMKMTVNGKETTFDFDLPSGDLTTRSLVKQCPDASPKPAGKVDFQCGADNKWRLSRQLCGFTE